MSIRVMVVDDHVNIRRMLSDRLNKEVGLEVVGEAKDGCSAIELALHIKPEVVLMDYNLPDMSGAEATRSILAHAPETRIIGLSSHIDGKVAEEMYEAGAEAYVVKEGDTRQLLSLIRDAG